MSGFDFTILKNSKNYIYLLFEFGFFMFTITCVNLSLGVYFEISFYDVASKLGLDLYKVL